MKPTMNNMKAVLMFTFVLAFGLNVMAQKNDSTRIREIGVRVSDTFGTVDYVKKKSTTKDPSVYKRNRLILDGGNIIALDGFLGNSFTSSFNVGFAFGKEKRYSLKHNFSFVTGREIILMGSSSFERHSFIWEESKASVGIGLVFGINYNVKDKLTIGIETIPSFISSIHAYHASTEEGGINATIDLFDFEFNRGICGLSIMYRF